MRKMRHLILPFITWARMHSWKPLVQTVQPLNWIWIMCLFHSHVLTKVDNKIFLLGIKNLWILPITWRTQNMKSCTVFFLFFFFLRIMGVFPLGLLILCKPSLFHLVRLSLLCIQCLCLWQKTIWSSKEMTLWTSSLILCYQTPIEQEWSRY